MCTKRVHADMPRALRQAADQASDHSESDSASSSDEHATQNDAAERRGGGPTALERVARARAFLLLVQRQQEDTARVPQGVVAQEAQAYLDFVGQEQPQGQ